jgi:sterol desaturase/sphingolipid hydroxylase (fatty acid hydroxylase superfamily)
MNQLLYFAAVIVISSAIFLLLFLLERVIPLRQSTQPLWQRLIVNTCVTALAGAVYLTCVQPAATFMLHWTAQQPFGLVQWIKLPARLSSAIRVALPQGIAFLLMDLTYYYWHRATHVFPFLWRFHNAHHIDRDLDVSTAFRFHFIEILLSTGFRVIQVAIIGISAPVYLLYEAAFQANTLFHHSNVKLPLELERWLNLVLVTPRMHGIHHSQVQEETNSNYSSVFPWWDRLHRTLRLNVPQSEIVIGVPAYNQPDDNKIQNILLLPFQPQRDYWYQPDRTKVERNSAVLGDKPTRMVDFEGVVSGSDDKPPVSTAQKKSM